jgi:hypothetical protein
MRGAADRLLTWFAAKLAARVEDQLAVRLQTELARHVNEKLLPEVARRADAEARDAITRQMAANPLIGSQLYLPSPAVDGGRDGDYMATSTPLTRDFLHAKFAEFLGLCGLPPLLHRKLWEWAFIYDRLNHAGMLQPGKRGLGFGVGQEMLPALFASLGVSITATDSPADEEHWADAGQHASIKELLFAPNIISRELFEDRVHFQPCDMRNVPPELNGFDFCWSSCCFEHLGTLERGLDFVLHSVEHTLAVGGVACHTTEVNLSSDEATIEAGRDIIYRKRDLLALCRTLEDRGHVVAPLRIEPGELLPDYLVDVPPYRQDVHLKLLIGRFVSTSIGLVIRRGR